MRQYTVAWDPHATLDLLRVRARLGPVRACDLDEDLEHARERLSAFPEIGAPAWLRGAWSKTVRRWIVGESGYVLFYRLIPAVEVVLVLTIRHEKQRSPRL
jgi:plasmid stabilization system protein ParE